VAQVTLDKLAFRYPGSADDALHGLQLQIENGEAHALLGASGVGKTTLLNLLSGLLTPTSGRILMNGKDVSAWPGYARGVAQVFQFPVLYESMSVAQNLAFPLRVRKFDKAATAERVAYVSEELGVSELAHQKPRALTLFEKQLVAVGKALMRPDISLVLLDEPLTAVEPKIKWRLRQTLRKAQEDLGVTMIYVTHDQTEALTFADRVSVLAPQGILQTASPKALYESPEHEFVGHFVGSPGMNFVPARVLQLDAAERIGFRPEWASMDTQGSLRGTVTRTRVLGARGGQPYGLVTLATEFGSVSVRAPLQVSDASVEPGAQVGVRIQRYVAFTAQQKVAEVELV
jgi:glycerol transport system ATP-binding protein